MRVLIGCEESQVICNAFRERGHEAYSCDIQDCSGGHPEYHIKASVLEIIKVKCFDLGIFHPTCTYLSHAGNGYFNIEKYGQAAIERMQKRIDAVEFFMTLYNAGIPRICVENPVGYINSFLSPTQVIHPYMFGEPHKKRTCLWLKGLPPLFHAELSDLFVAQTHVSAPPIYVDKSGEPRYFTEAITGGRATTQKERSKTFQGIANAMAEQWGGGITSTFIHLTIKYKTQWEESRRLTQNSRTLSYLAKATASKKRL